MKRTIVTFCLVIFGVLACPQPASAGLWAWLNELSGPGRFRGEQFDIRLFCVGGHTSAKDFLERAVFELQFAEALLEKYGARSFNRELLKPLSDKLVVASTKPVTMATLLPLLMEADALSPELRNACGKGTDCSDATRKAVVHAQNAIGFLRTANRQAHNELGTLFSSASVSYSFCPTEREAGAVAVGLLFRSMSFKEKDNAVNPYAGGNEIRLTTLGSSVMWHPIDRREHPRLDIVDIGFAISAYWFSDKGEKPGGFESFSGVMIEPFRLDFHVPSSVRDSKCFWWTAVPYAQISTVVFPGGFGPNAFGPNLDPRKADRIPAHYVTSWNIWFDLQPIVQHLSKGK